jgi:biotin--protein ligase
MNAYRIPCRNPKVLRSLPTPFLSLASFQLSGRGRGSNQWLSPPGCLQFSLLLDLPHSFPANKLVFIQYLAALAICDGLDTDGKLGVKIKWPNDIYGEAEGIGGTVVGKGVKGKAKLGGILVNSSFVDGQWKVIVGCGINILNELPTTSLSQLQDVKAKRDHHRQGSADINTEQSHNGAGVSMEKSLAKILVSFEGFWNTFLEDKGFENLLDEYLGRWLHT